MTETPAADYDYAAAKRRSAFVQGLRDMADFLEQHPNVDHPKNDTMNVFVSTREDIVRNARGSSWEKIYNDTWFYLRKEFGEDLIFEINCARATICRQVEIGEKIVPAQPAQPERVEKVYEWICDDASLLTPQSAPTAVQAEPDPRRI